MINTNSTSYDFLYFAQICFDGRFMYTFIDLPQLEASKLEPAIKVLNYLVCQKAYSILFPKSVLLIH